jgi:meiotic recombination protein SPO11
VDFDPDGIQILSTYKYGSFALLHENKRLVVPTIQWLGVKSNDFLDIEDRIEPHGLLRLTARDRRLAKHLLDREVLQEDGPEKEWRREVQVMLILNVKAEIQIMSNGGSFTNWLTQKIYRLC